MTSNFPVSKKTPRRRPALSPDLSPMSALGLMLVNFFMVQASWQQPQVMPVAMPSAPGENEPKIVDFAMLTLLCGHEKVYAYVGLTAPRLDSTDYSAEGLRQLMVQQKQLADARFGPEEYKDHKTGTLKKGSSLRVVIKALPSARYGDLVDVLDEMRICDIHNYTILDVMPAELRFIRAPQKGLIFETGGNELPAQ